MMSLATMLRSHDTREFKTALAELSSLPGNEAVPLLEHLALEAEYEFRCRAMTGMSQVMPERGESLAIELLGDPEPLVRVKATDTLRKSGSRQAVPIIARLLESDPDSLVRSWAAFSLGELGDATTIPVLAAAAEKDRGTDHEGRPIRETAIASIKAIQTAIRGK
jgi:HEAT repeat protein